MNAIERGGAGTGRRTGAVLLTFLYMWLMVGLFAGTAVLLGPVQWVTSALEAAGGSQSGEDLVLKGLILAYMVMSVLASRWLVQRMYRSQRRPVRLGIPMVATVLAGLSLWGWTNPGRMLAHVAGGTETELTLESGAQFLFGPYPDRARLAELKEQGVTAVVSLQHPAVPIEVPGIRAERIAAAELGLTFIHAPMLPWVSENEASLEMIRELVREGRGTYYIHCGLGRDRANMVRHLIERTGVPTNSATGAYAALRFEDRARQHEEGEVPSPGFERGLLTKLEPDVWLVPHPNHRELFGYMLAGQVEHVVTLLDPSDPEQAAWLEDQRRVFRQQGVTLTVATLRAGETERARQIVEFVRSLPRPVAVVAPRTTWSDYEGTADGAEVAATLHRAYTAEAVGAARALVAASP